MSLKCLLKCVSINGNIYFSLSLALSPSFHLFLPLLLSPWHCAHHSPTAISPFRCLHDPSVSEEEFINSD